MGDFRQLYVKSPQAMLEYVDSKSIPEPNSGCLIWLGWQSSGFNKAIPRATMMFSGKQTFVARVLWQAVKGDIPQGMFICHKCDVPMCVNINHLFLGTRQDNVDDMIRKGRYRGHGRLPGTKIGHKRFCKYGHETAIRYGRMVCPTCTREFSRRYYNKSGRDARRKRLNQTPRQFKMPQGV